MFPWESMVAYPGYSRMVDAFVVNVRVVKFDWPSTTEAGIPVQNALGAVTRGGRERTGATPEEERLTVPPEPAPSLAVGRPDPRSTSTLRVTTTPRAQVCLVTGSNESSPGT